MPSRVPYRLAPPPPPALVRGLERDATRKARRRAVAIYRSPTAPPLLLPNGLVRQKAGRVGEETGWGPPTGWGGGVYSTVCSGRGGVTRPLQTAGWRETLSEGGRGGWVERGPIYRARARNGPAGRPAGWGCWCRAAAAGHSDGGGPAGSPRAVLPRVVEGRSGRLSWGGGGTSRGARWVSGGGGGGVPLARTHRVSPSRSRQSRGCLPGVGRAAQRARAGGANI